jgi:hypothetical protein
MVLKFAKSGPAEGKPRVEEYALGELVAAADGLLAGLGQVMAGLAGVAVAGCAAGTLDEAEEVVAVRGREVLLQVLQLCLDTQAAGEVRMAGVTGADGVARTRAEPGRARHLLTLLGRVRVSRIAYRSGVRGVPSLFPRDGVLDLPAAGYSWRLQELVVMLARDGSYEQACGHLLATTGISVGKRQAEQITIAAAAGAPGFYPALARAQEQQEQQGQDEQEQQGQDEQEEEGGLVVLSADGKGVSMLPGARRGTSLAPGQRVQNFEHHRGTGEKGHKRMAEIGCVFGIEPVPRTPEQVMAPSPPGGKDAPQARDRWYAIDLAAGREVTISAIFGQAVLRDPDLARPWLALADGDIHQIRLLQAQAAARGITLTILIDFIHVLGYLRKAAWCFHPPRDPAIEDWVSAQALDILHGRVPDVITRISQLAAQHPPQLSEHARIIRSTLTYLTNKQPHMDYPAALAAGWPIATGVIEGACRHLVQDRMAITGARWGLAGAEAILWLRAIRANGDHHTYWTHHIRQQHQRNHLTPYHATLTPDTFTLAA